MPKGLNSHKRDAGGGQPYCGRRGRGVYLTATKDADVNCRFCLRKMFKHGIKLEAWQTEYLHGVDDV